MQNHNSKPQKHLINILCSTKSHHPNFTLLLGAGASVTSGVKSSRDMIKEWRQQYSQMYSDQNQQKLESQPWYGTDLEYSALFEILYDQQSQRREYIETTLENASPSWGYIYLVNLLRRRTFNTTFTTNFDDLLNEACYVFSGDTRPIVCAHDSSIRSVRITSKRPKIIKLHGDFLFDDIKNTLTELESLEDNMRGKFKQYANEFGLIVLGYSGRDRSIMSILNTLLRSDTNFPHGVYWCVHSESDIQDDVLALTRFPRFNLIEIEGFDEFFAELHGELEFELQPEMVDPYGALTERLNSLMDDTRIPKDKKHLIIDKDISQLVQTISRQITPLNRTLPFKLLAEEAYKTGQSKEALDLIRKQLEVLPTPDMYDFAFKLVEDESVPTEFLDYIVESFKQNIKVIDDRPNDIYNYAIAVMNRGVPSIASELLNLVAGRSASGVTRQKIDHHLFVINSLLAKLLQDDELSDSEISELRLLSDQHSEDKYKIGFYILLGEFDSAMEILRTGDLGYLMTFLRWPIAKLLPSENIKNLLDIVRARKEESGILEK